MMFSSYTYFTLVCCMLIRSSFCENAGEFHCKPKAGCHISRCDPAPSGLKEEGFNLAEFLRRSEFPITCVGDKNETPREQKEMETLKQEVKKVWAEMAELKDYISKMNKNDPTTTERSITTTAIRTSTANQWCQQAYDGVPYNNTCLWAEDAPSSMSAADALAICIKKSPSKLPDVYNEKEYIEIMQYMRNNIPPHQNHVFAWTGMKRDHSTGKAVLSTGEPALYTKPRDFAPEWRAAEAVRTRVFLIASIGESALDQGMGALWDGFALTSQPKIVLCQKI